MIKLRIVVLVCIPTKNKIMKKIIVLILAMVTIVAAQAQKERIPDQRDHRDKMMAEKLKLSEEQRQKTK